MTFKKSLAIIALLIYCMTSHAQNQPIGSWNSMLSYNTGYGAATDGTTIYAVSKQGFYVFRTDDPYIISYSKVNGMSDQGMQDIAYDTLTKTAILTYDNGNIDLFQNNIFYNIADLKVKTIAGDKIVYQIYTYNGKAYLSTTLGIIVIDLEKHALEETYQFIVNNQFIAVKGFTELGGNFYAATDNGLYRADANSQQLQDFQGAWTRIDSTHAFNSVISFADHIIASTTKSVYVLSDTIRKFYTGVLDVAGLSAGFNRLYVAEYTPYKGNIALFDAGLNKVDTFKFYDKPRQVLELKDSSMWMSLEFTGLAKRNKKNQLEYYLPFGPGDLSSFDIFPKDKHVWIAHGGYSDKYSASGNHNGLTEYTDGKWRNYRRDPYYSYGPFGDTMVDFVAIVQNKEGTVYAGSFNYGLFELKSDESYNVYNSNSFMDASTPNPGQFQVIGLAIDKSENLWMTMFGSYHELYVKEAATGNWYKYHVDYNRYYPYSGGPMTFDRQGNVWYASLFGGGVIGYSTNGTLDDTTDDVTYHMINGVGYGNLPNATTYCVAADKNDNLWIGTSDGIGILYNASGCLAKHCDAEIPVVQYDKYAGYLFSGERVHAIAVDGANRKWIGTDNGVWLLSPDAGNSKIILHFTADNSPLPSNTIQKIAIDPVTGDVYIGTDGGLICYRGTATEATTDHNNVLSYPNPVPSGYKGTIAIRGLPENADVRITDINGQLIYKTTALGGQAVWNGYDYKGRRPQSGVYLVFASNTDGGQVYAGKLVFLQ